MSERLEVSIFKDLNYTKTFISSIMRTDIRNGLGSTMIELVRALSTGLEDLTYRGLAYTLPGGLSTSEHHNRRPTLSDEEFQVKFGCHVSMFGGSAFEMYRQNDSSRFAHVLPGLHDVDTNLFLRCSSEQESFEYPISRVSVDRLRSGQGSALQQSHSPLSFLLAEVVSIIRTHVEDAVLGGRIQLEYDLNVKGETHRLSLEQPDHPSGDRTCLYTELVHDLFRVKIVDEGIMLKVQVEVKPVDRATFESVTDHVFELIIELTDRLPSLQGFDSAFGIIRGVNVDKKRISFFKTTASLLDRSVMYRMHRMMEGKDSRAEANKAKGKCAQDFLRVLYIFLTEMEDSSGANDTWIHEKTNLHTLPMRPGHVIKYRMIDKIGNLALPLDIFFFLTSFLEPCVQASTISTIDVFESADETHGFREIIETFQEAFPERAKAAFLSSEEIKQMFFEYAESMLMSMEDDHLRLRSN